MVVLIYQSGSFFPRRPRPGKSRVSPVEITCWHAYRIILRVSRYSRVWLSNASLSASVSRSIKYRRNGSTLRENAVDIGLSAIIGEYLLFITLFIFSIYSYFFHHFLRKMYK